VLRMRRAAVSVLGGGAGHGSATRRAQRGHGPDLADRAPHLWRAARREGRQEGSTSDEDSWHDWTHQGVATGQAVSGLPSVAPGAAPGAEHGVRQ